MRRYILYERIKKPTPPTPEAAAPRRPRGAPSSPPFKPPLAPLLSAAAAIGVAGQRPVWRGGGGGLLDRRMGRGGGDLPFLSSEGGADGGDLDKRRPAAALVDRGRAGDGMDLGPLGLDRTSISRTSAATSTTVWRLSGAIFASSRTPRAAAPGMVVVVLSFTGRGRPGSRLDRRIRSVIQSGWS